MAHIVAVGEESDDTACHNAKGDTTPHEFAVVGIEELFVTGGADGNFADGLDFLGRKRQRILVGLAVGIHICV